MQKNRKFDRIKKMYYNIKTNNKGRCFLVYEKRESAQ